MLEKSILEKDFLPYCLKHNVCCIHYCGDKNLNVCWWSIFFANMHSPSTSFTNIVTALTGSWKLPNGKIQICIGSFQLSWKILISPREGLLQTTNYFHWLELDQIFPIVFKLGPSPPIDSIFILVKPRLLDWADVRNNSRIDKYSTSFHLLNGVWHDYHWFRLHGKKDF